MEIDAVTVRFDQSQSEGWMLSSQLHGASAKGWAGESGNFITRYSTIQLSENADVLQWMLPFLLCFNESLT